MIHLNRYKMCWKRNKRDKLETKWNCCWGGYEKYKPGRIDWCLAVSVRNSSSFQPFSNLSASSLLSFYSHRNCKISSEFQKNSSSILLQNDDSSFAILLHLSISIISWCYSVSSINQPNQSAQSISSINQLFNIRSAISWSCACYWNVFYHMNVIKIVSIYHLFTIRIHESYGYYEMHLVLTLLSK